MAKPPEFQDADAGALDDPNVDADDLTVLHPRDPAAIGDPDDLEPGGEDEGARTTAIATPEEEGGEEAAEATEAGEPGEGGEEAAEGGEETAAPDRTLIDWVTQNRPQYRGVASKYQNNQDLIDGLLNTAVRIGQRDDDAELGRVVRDRKDEIFAYLSGQPPAAGQPAAPRGPAIPGPEQLASWQAAVDANPANPPREAVEGLRKAGNEALRFFLKVQTPEGAQEFMAPILQQHTQQIQQAWQQQSAQHSVAYQDAVKFKSHVDRNSSWLFENGNAEAGVFTPLGARFSAHFDQAIALRMPAALAFEHAQGKLAGEQLAAIQKNNGAVAASPGARRKPQVASPTPGTRSEKDEMKLIKNESVKQTLLRVMREQEGRGA